MGIAYAETWHVIVTRQRCGEDLCILGIDVWLSGSAGVIGVMEECDGGM